MNEKILSIVIYTFCFVLLIGSVFILLLLSQTIGYSKYNPISWIETYQYKMYHQKMGTYEWNDIRRCSDGRFQHKVCSYDNIPLVAHYLYNLKNYRGTHNYNKETCIKAGGEWEWEHMTPIVYLG